MKKPTKKPTKNRAKAKRRGPWKACACGRLTSAHSGLCRECRPPDDPPRKPPRTIIIIDENQNK